MPSALLPSTIPTRLAAIIAGRSPAGFVRDLLPTTAALGGGVNLAALERRLGREITIEDYLRADRKLDDRREQQRRTKEPAQSNLNRGGSSDERRCLEAP